MDAGKMKAMKIIAVLVVGGIVVYHIDKAAEQWSSAAAVAVATPQVKSKPQPTIDKSPAIQAKRFALIQKLFDQGLFTKLTQGDMPKVYVTPRFYALDFDDKGEIYRGDLCPCLSTAAMNTRSCDSSTLEPIRTSARL